MAGEGRIRRQRLTLTVLLLSSISGAPAAGNNNDNGRRGRSKGRGQAPPQPGDLSTIDETNKLLVAGVEMPAMEYHGNSDDEREEELPKIRGMLYHYEPMLPPYNGQYLEEELPVPKPVPPTSPLSNNDSKEDYDGNDDIVATNEDSSGDQAVDNEIVSEMEEASEDEGLSTTVQEEYESQPAGDVRKDDADAESAGDVVDAAMDEAAFDESNDAGADVNDELEERDATETIIEDGVDDDHNDDDSNDDDHDHDDPNAHSVDENPSNEKEEVDIATENEPTPSSLADDIVDAAMLLDEGAIEAIAEEMAEGVRETDVELPAAAATTTEEKSSATDVEDLANDVVSGLDEPSESPEKEEKIEGHKDDGEQLIGSEKIVVDEMDDGGLENVPESTLDQETDDETAQEESQPPTVSEVESPKAPDNSYVAAEKSTMPQTNDDGSDSNTASANATLLADHNASVAKEPQEPDDKTSEENPSLTTDDVEDRPAANGRNAKETIDIDDRSTETVGKDVEADDPSVVLKEATADARRIAEEKGVPTNIDNSDIPAASDFNVTNDESILNEDSPAYDGEAGSNKEDFAGSSHNASMLVSRQDEEAATPDVEKDHESWRGVYEREPGEKETQKNHDETNNTTDDTKRTDIDSLDNIREYIASSGEEMFGSMPSEAIFSQEENGVVADKGDVEIEVLKDDANEWISSSVDAKRGLEMNEDDPSEGMATESITATDSMNDVTEEETTAMQGPRIGEEEVVELRWGEEAESSSEESIDLKDLPDISSLRNSFSSSDVNSNFIDGIDDLDKFLEEVDTPDELDVAHGSSMQEVLVGKGVQILVKKVTAVVRRVKFVASKVKYRIANSMVAEKIREGIETSGIIALGEKVREASNISEHKEKVVGIGQKIGQVFDEKMDSMNKFFDDVMENDTAQSASKILERIKGNSAVRRIISTLGLSDEDEDDDDLMDFSSFSRMQQQGSGSGTEPSLEDRLAAMRQMY